MYSFHEHGQPIVDDALCIGCGDCITICPDEVFSLENGKARPGAGIFVGCIACGQCVSICPTTAIRVSGRDMRADDLIELPPKSSSTTADQLEALLLWRRSIRRFTDEEVSRAAVDRILEMTATAPMGIPPSEVGVIVFHGKQKVREFAAEACATFARQAKMFSPWMLALMRPFWGKATYEIMRDFVQPLMRMLADKHAEGKDYFTYGAPAALLFHHPATADAADSYIAATYAMLAAESLGLGSCLLGSPVALNYNPQFKAKYGIPKSNKIALAMPFGHPAAEFRRGVRRRLGDVRFA